MFLTVISREIHHFRKLSFAAQQLLISSAIYALAYPLLFVFSNTFIWRETSSFRAIGLYNFGFCFSLPLFFLVNGWLLRRVNIKNIFLVGLVGQGLVTMILFFIPSIQEWMLLALGCLQGIPMALYWANRNFITLNVTHDQERNYFSALEMSIDTVIGIALPFVIGWFLVAGEKFGGYTTQQAYQFLVTVATLLLLVAGILFRRADVKQPVIGRLRIKKVSRQWWYSRGAEVCQGSFDRMSAMLPSIVVITFIGTEGALGTVQSFLSIISMVVIYILARKSQPHHRILILLVGATIVCAASLIFAASFSYWSAVLFLIGFSSSAHFIWTALNPTQLKSIEDQEDRDPANHYAYVIDRELFLNIGRVISLGIFFVLIALFSQLFALRYIALFIAASQFLLVILASRISSQKKPSLRS
jgi:YQGE family putative transporter